MRLRVPTTLNVDFFILVGEQKKKSGNILENFQNNSLTSPRRYFILSITTWSLYGHCKVKGDCFIFYDMLIFFLVNAHACV